MAPDLEQFVGRAFGPVARKTKERIEDSNAEQSERAGASSFNAGRRGRTEASRDGPDADSDNELPSGGPLVRTSFMILSDTYNLTLNDPGPLVNPLPEVDVVLHCGGLTPGGGIDNYKKAIEMLDRIPAELKLVIAGSRDLSLDSKFWEEHTAPGTCDCDPEESTKALAIMAQAKNMNIHYLEEGKHEFELSNGAYFSVWASPYTPNSYHPQTGLHDDLRAFTYDPSDNTYINRFNIEGTDPRTTFFSLEIDILCTAAPPDNFNDDTWSPPNPLVADTIGSADLRYVVPRLMPRVHCFGQNHAGYGMRIVNWSFENDDKPGRRPPGLYGAANWEMSRETLLAPINPYPKALKMSKYGLGGLGTGKSTMFVNACIMDTENRPTNVPWVLAMDLPVGKENRNVVGHP